MQPLRQIVYQGRSAIYQGRSELAHDLYELYNRLGDPAYQAVRDALHRKLAQRRGSGVVSASLVLQEATTADIPTLVTLVHAAFEEYRGQLDPPTGPHNETPETFRQALQTGYAALALVNGEAVGCVFYHQEG